MEEIETVETTTTISEIDGPYLDIQTTEEIPYDIEETAQRIVEQVVHDVTTELRQGPIFIREVVPVVETTLTEEVRLECQVTGIPQPTIKVHHPLFSKNLYFQQLLISSHHLHLATIKKKIVNS